MSGVPQRFDVLVAGAGVVGVACARALQRAGLRVCLADPQPPGSGCSHGNAGVIASEHVLPLAHPGTLRKLPRMLVTRHGPLYLKATRVPGLAPWLLRFAAACSSSRVTAGARATAALTSAAVATWRQALAASGGSHLLSSRGLYAVYRSEAAFARDAEERALARRFGVDWQVLDGAALRQREPALSPTLVRAVYYPGVAHVLDPGGVVRCLADRFSADGGRLVAAPVTGLSCEPHAVTATLGGGRVSARYVVVAAGVASRSLCAMLGLDPPLVAEMGYHLTFPGAETRLESPVAAAEDGYIATPMGDHLRVAGTVEFARREQLPDWSRAGALGARAARLFEQPLPPPAARWRGSRPTLPDYLPMIGPLPGHPRVLAAFGHQHIGLTTAAVTAELVRDLVLGVPPALDMVPYAAGRFTARPVWR